jgi:hypothetical protein
MDKSLRNPCAFSFEAHHTFAIQVNEVVFIERHREIQGVFRAARNDLARILVHVVARAREAVDVPVIKETAVPFGIHLMLRIAEYLCE